MMHDLDPQKLSQRPPSPSQLRHTPVNLRDKHDRRLARKEEAVLEHAHRLCELLRRRGRVSERGLEVDVDDQVAIVRREGHQAVVGAGQPRGRATLPDPRVAAGERRQRRYPPHGSLCKGGGDLDRDRVRGAHPVAELGLVHAHHHLLRRVLHQLLAQERTLAALDDVAVPVDGVGRPDRKVDRGGALGLEAGDAKPVQLRLGLVRGWHRADAGQLAALDSLGEPLEHEADRRTRAHPEHHARRDERVHRVPAGRRSEPGAVVRPARRGLGLLLGARRRGRLGLAVSGFDSEDVRRQLGGERVRGLRAPPLHRDGRDVDSPGQRLRERLAARGHQVSERTEEPVPRASRVGDALGAEVGRHLHVRRRLARQHEHAASPAERHHHRAGPLCQDGTRRSLALLDRVGRHARQQRSLRLVGADHVAQRVQLVRQRLGRRRSRVEDGRQAGGATRLERGQRGRHRHLELGEQDARGRKGGRRRVDVGGAELAVCARHDEDLVLAARGDRDLRHAAGGGAGGGDVRGVDAEGVKIGDGGLPKAVRSQLGHHEHGAAEE
mmetsp:Transcript_5351/g.17786  ORF Transcript_5351/g.17786 Transcript_5351/m.17786 type:complete len:553 (-) Transcript_5351:180-1838(-)